MEGGHSTWARGEQGRALAPPHVATPMQSSVFIDTTELNQPATTRGRRPPQSCSSQARPMPFCAKSGEDWGRGLGRCEVSTVSNMSVIPYNPHTLSPAHMRSYLRSGEAHADQQSDRLFVGRRRAMHVARRFSLSPPKLFPHNPVGARHSTPTPASVSGTAWPCDAPELLARQDQSMMQWRVCACALACVDTRIATLFRMCVAHAETCLSAFCA